LAKNWLRRIIEQRCAINRIGRQLDFPVPVRHAERAYSAAHKPGLWGLEASYSEGIGAATPVAFGGTDQMDTQVFGGR